MVEERELAKGSKWPAEVLQGPRVYPDSYRGRLNSNLKYSFFCNLIPLLPLNYMFLMKLFDWIFLRPTKNFQSLLEPIQSSKMFAQKIVSAHT